MAESSESKPQPSNPESQISRRGFLRRAKKWAVGAAGFLALGSSARAAEAQSLFPIAPKPVAPTESPVKSPAPQEKSAESQLHPANRTKPFESKQTPDLLTPETLKEKQKDIQDSAIKASNYLGQEPIKVKFHDAGKKTHVWAKYHPDNDLNTIHEPSLEVRLSYEDNQPFDYTMLHVWRNLARIARAYKGTYISAKFPEMLLETTGIDLKQISKGDVRTMQKLGSIRPYLDYANYTDGVSREEMFTRANELSDEINDRAIAIVTVKPKELVAKLSEASPDEQKSLANAFVGALKLQMDGMTGSSWEALGLDKTSVFQLIGMSKNTRLKSYFEEKITALSS